MNEQLYNVSANPHVRDKASTHSIMLDVIIALLPATLFGFWNFGVKAIINTVICVAVCVLAEYVWQRCMHQKITIKQCSTYWFIISIKPSARSTILDSCYRWFIRNHRCKTAFWWFRPELYEPCAWSTLLLINFFCRNYDQLLL